MPQSNGPIRAAKGGQASPEEQVRALYEQAESRTAKAVEEMVAGRGFGWVFARTAENVAALIHMSSELADLVLRNARIASRADIARLARQWHRTEDKLERVLQELEQVRDELARERSAEGLRDSGQRPERTRPGPHS